MCKSKVNPHYGSCLDKYLEEALLDEAKAKLAKKVLAWQFAEAMRKRRVTKSALAGQMDTSRAQLDRLLDPETQSVTVRTVARAANILGMTAQKGGARVGPILNYGCMRSTVLLPLFSALRA